MTLFILCCFFLGVFLFVLFQKKKQQKSSRYYFTYSPVEVKISYRINAVHLKKVKAAIQKGILKRNYQQRMLAFDHDYGHLPLPKNEQLENGSYLYHMTHAVPFQMIGSEGGMNYPYLLFRGYGRLNTGESSFVVPLSKEEQYQIVELLFQELKQSHFENVILHNVYISQNRSFFTKQKSQLMKYFNSKAARTHPEFQWLSLWHYEQLAIRVITYLKDQNFEYRTIRISTNGQAGVFPDKVRVELYNQTKGQLVFQAVVVNQP